MELAFKPELPVLVATHHEHITVGINSCYMVISTRDGFDVLTRLKGRFLLLDDW
jgi:hypothetical protein